MGETYADGPLPTHPEHAGGRFGQAMAMAGLLVVTLLTVTPGPVQAGLAMAAGCVVLAVTEPLLSRPVTRLAVAGVGIVAAAWLVFRTYPAGTHRLAVMQAFVMTVLAFQVARALFRWARSRMGRAPA
jgi:hypothetical protein